MKKINLLTLLLSLFTLVILTESCDKAEELLDPCASVTCQNNGVCNDGTCDCPDGYIGTNCENFDLSQVQALLDDGQSPKILFEGGISLDSLYGKMYQGGLIFFVDVNEELELIEGMVAHPENQSTGAGWGCGGMDLMGLNNVEWNGGIPEGSGSEIGDGKDNTAVILDACSTDDIAAKLCRDKGPEWFLPSIKELNLMYTNLHLKGHGGFDMDNWYWSSTEMDDSSVWNQQFGSRGQGYFYKDSIQHIRAARAFTF